MKDNEPNNEEYKHEEIKDPKLDEMINNSTHPEMQDLKGDEQFTVVNFGSLGDPLNKSLQDRIDKLREDVEEDEDEDEDDGGDVVIARV